MNESNSLLPVSLPHNAVDDAIRELQKAGIDSNKLLIIGRDCLTDGRAFGDYSTGDRIKAWGGIGAFWGGLWGLMFGSVFFWIPSLGPLSGAGPMIAWIVSALVGAAAMAGINVLGATLYSLGIPKDSLVHYESAVKAGKYALIIHGSLVEAAHANETLSPSRPETLERHQ